MNLKATLGEITVTFTPDEWPRIQALLQFAVDDVERLNREAFEEMAGLKEPSREWWKAPKITNQIP